MLAKLNNLMLEAGQQKKESNVIKRAVAILKFYWTQQNPN